MILHIVGARTHFHAARFLPTSKAGSVLDTFRGAWLLLREVHLCVTMKKRGEFLMKARSLETAYGGKNPHARTGKGDFRVRRT